MAEKKLSAEAKAKARVKELEAQLSTLANAIGVDPATGSSFQPPQPAPEENPVVYPLPVPTDQNDPGPSFEATKQQLRDAENRVRALEAKLAEVTAE